MQDRAGRWIFPPISQMGKQRHEEVVIFLKAILESKRALE